MEEEMSLHFCDYRSTTSRGLKKGLKAYLFFLYISIDLVRDIFSSYKLCIKKENFGYHKLVEFSRP